ATILHVAHRAVESLTLDREVLHLRDALVPRYAEMVYYGYWHTPEREMLQAAMDEAQKDVSGTARVKLYKGSCWIAGRRSARSLYRLDMATFEEDDVYRQKDAEGIIRLNALRLAIRASRKQVIKREGAPSADAPPKPTGTRRGSAGKENPSRASAGPAASGERRIRRTRLLRRASRSSGGSSVPTS